MWPVSQHSWTLPGGLVARIQQSQHSCCIWSFMTGFIHLAYIFKVHTCCSIYMDSLSVHHLMDIWIFFHFLAIAYSATVNICLQVFVWTYVFNCFEYIPRSGTAGSFGNSVFNFWRNSKTVCQSSFPTYDLVSSLWGFHFLHILATPCHYLPFWCGLPLGYEVLSYCDFDLHIPDG